MKIRFETIKHNLKWIAAGLIIGLLSGWAVFHSGAERTINTHEGHERDEAESTIWTCSMHPQIRQDKPGKCPICAMDLVPLNTMETGIGNADPNEFLMTESAAMLADIQTLRIVKGAPVKELFLQGKVQPDERNIAELTARFGGRIEKLFVNYAGQNVAKGQKLATIYSPDLVTAQKELLEAISYRESRPALYTAAKGKLRLWDLTDEQINKIEEKGEPTLYFDVLSPISGTVMVRNIAMGDYVKEGNALFRVVDLTKVWVMFDAYESDLPWIKLADRVDFTIPSLPGKTYFGRVSYIDPFIHPDTRVSKIRVELDNKGLRIKPEMFVNGILHSAIAGSENAILIPRSAVLWTGKRAVVYVKVPDRETPTFLYREITLGPSAGKFYVVSDGLMEGEEIAVNGVFRIDAASQLAGLPSMMNPEGGKSALGHDHISMDAHAESEHSAHQVVGKKAGEVKTNDEFKEQLQAVYEAYLLFKDAFVASDPHQVSLNAAKLRSALGNVDMGLLEGDAHTEWMSQLSTMQSNTDKISGSNDIVEQRSFFASFNNAFYQSLKSFGIQHGTVYYQYCPMAIGEKGAYWLSSIKEIKNPYFGESMLSCGETRETMEY